MPPHRRVRLRRGGARAEPIRGVAFLPPSALRNPRNRDRAVSLTREQFRYVFGNALSAAESDELLRPVDVPVPGKPLFEAALANLLPRSPVKVDTRNSDRGPLLLTAARRDRTVPPAIVKQRCGSTGGRAP